MADQPRSPLTGQFITKEQANLSDRVTANAQKYLDIHQDLGSFVAGLLRTEKDRTKEAEAQKDALLVIRDLTKEQVDAMEENADAAGEMAGAIQELAP